MFEDAIHVSSELPSVIHHRDMVPGTKRMKKAPVDQWLIAFWRVDQRFETPLLPNHADLKHDPRVGILACLWIQRG